MHPDMHPALPGGLGLATPRALHAAGLPRDGQGGTLTARSPIDGQTLASFHAATPDDVRHAIHAARDAFHAWRVVPPPVRGELVRRFAQKLREHKADLAALVTLEAGKITAEALGEVQEMIDVCDLAVGQSRMLFGRTIASERPQHRMAEQWHPLGVVGVITAFNFPVAVWAWNAALALVCGNGVVWKPSDKTPLTALACQHLLQQVIDASTDLPVPAGLVNLAVGGRDAGETLADSPDVALVSATGSTPMGRDVATRVARRLGRSLLELGGNNAMTVTPSADLDLCTRAVTFSAFGTAGQRCTTLRRLIAHASVADALHERLAAVVERLPVGDPRTPGTLVGPLIDDNAYAAMQATLQEVRDAGHSVVGGTRITDGVPAGGVYVRPALCRVPADLPCVARETFAPILYLLTYDDFDEAVALNNGVPQGLSSAVFTGDMREAERFVAADGSDCGIANVNIGTSGAEVGGAFGGEKETGGGRESGSDAWKAYMRRATSTVNYGTALPLAQGIDFDV